MTTLSKLSALLENEAAAHGVAELLSHLDDPAPAAVTVFEAGPGGHGWTLSAYFAEDTPSSALAAIAALVEIQKPGVVLKPEFVENEDWAAKVQRDLHPVRAGPFLVHGSHDRAAARGVRYAIEVDAGEAFGTAHHATTAGCLEAIGRLARYRRFESIADIGCGTGVLAIAAAMAWPRARMVASDIDPIAVAVAQQNVRLNRRRFPVIAAAGFEHRQLRAAAQFDLVLANILAEPLQALAPTMRRALVRGGCAVLSGLLTSQASRVEAAYVASGFANVGRFDRNGWTALIVTAR